MIGAHAVEGHREVGLNKLQKVRREPWAHMPDFVLAVTEDKGSQKRRVMAATWLCKGTTGVILDTEAGLFRRHWRTCGGAVLAIYGGQT